jgi:hypothetical protein
VAPASNRGSFGPAPSVDCQVTIMGTSSSGPNRRAVLGGLAALPLLSGSFHSTSAQAQTAPGDPLPSWNDGPAKSAIIGLVKSTTDTASPNFVPPDARIATFDQDGTTWVEHPVYTQVVYCLERGGEGKAASEGGGAVQDRAVR